MAWKKESDTAAHHPLVLRALTVTDWQPAFLTGHDFANLLWGLVSRAATSSAGYTTDYEVTAGVLANLAGHNWRWWVDLAVQIGYLTPVDVEAGEEEAWLLVEDSEGLFHIRTAASIQWEKDRKKDIANPGFTVPARLRDGDGCRYCGAIVNWAARRGARYGTYDHRVPGERAQSPEDLRVSCARCNGLRSDRDDADLICPLLPAPEQPFYGKETVLFLAGHGHHVPLSDAPRPATKPGPPARPAATPPPAGPRTRPRDPAASGTTHRTPRPARQADPAPASPAPSATPPPAGPRRTTATPPPAGPRTPRPGTPPDTAPELPGRRSADPADRRDTKVRNPGRDGSGRVGLRPGPGPGARSIPEPAADPAPPRRTRGRRGRPTQPDKDTP